MKFTKLVLVLITISILFLVSGCVDKSVCGNGVCEIEETPENCSTDCGQNLMTCSALGGITCATDKNCSTYTLPASDSDFCCIQGECVLEVQDTSIGSFLDLNIGPEELDEIIYIKKDLKEEEEELDRLYENGTNNQIKTQEKIVYQKEKELENIISKKPYFVELENKMMFIDSKAKSWSSNYSEALLLSIKDDSIISGVSFSEDIRNDAPEKPYLNYMEESMEQFPEQFDWRNFNGKNYVSGVKNQGSCGSCWAFSATASLESSIKAYYNQPNFEINLSEQDVISCYSVKNGACGGAYDYEIQNFFTNHLASNGVCEENCFPYVARSSACSNKCSNYFQTNWKTSDVEVIQPSVENIKRALLEYGPVEVGMLIYADFPYYSEGIYYPTTDNISGAHAVTIVGYDQYDGQEYWIVKNSWGSGWGEEGYFRIYVGNALIDSWFAFAPKIPFKEVSNLEINCEDLDGDGYCYWGTGNEKPSSCSNNCNQIKDCNDSNYNENIFCQNTIPELGGLNINSNQENVEVYVLDLNSPNFIYRGNTPVTINILPGLRTIKLSKPGYYDKIEQVTIIANSEVNIISNLLWDNDYKVGWNFISPCEDASGYYSNNPDNFAFLDIGDRKILLSENKQFHNLEIDRKICAKDISSNPYNPINTGSWDNARLFGNVKPLVSDIDSDGQEEYIFSSGKKLVAINSDGEQIESWEPTIFNDFDAGETLPEKIKILDPFGLGCIISDVFGNSNKEIICPMFDMNTVSGGVTDYLVVFDNKGTMIKDYNLGRRSCENGIVAGKYLGKNNNGLIILRSGQQCNELLALDYNGVYKKTEVLPENGHGLSLIGALNLDNQQLFIEVGSYGIYLMDINLNTINQYDYPYSYNGWGSIISDLNISGFPKIIIANDTNLLFLDLNLNVLRKITPLEINLNSRFTTESVPEIVRQILAVNIDDDQMLELVVAHRKKIRVFDFNSMALNFKVIWEKQLPYNIQFLEANDIDKDNFPEIIAFTDSSQVAIFNLGTNFSNNNKRIWNSMYQNNERNSNLFFDECDLDCDGDVDIYDFDELERLSNLGIPITINIVTGAGPKCRQLVHVLAPFWQNGEKRIYPEDIQEIKNQCNIN